MPYNVIVCDYKWDMDNVGLMMVPFFTDRIGVMSNYANCMYSYPLGGQLSYLKVWGSGGSSFFIICRNLVSKDPATPIKKEENDKIN